MKMNNFSIYNMYLTICKNLSVPPSTVACPPPSKKFLAPALFWLRAAISGYTLKTDLLGARSASDAKYDLQKQNSIHILQTAAMERVRFESERYHYRTCLYGWRFL